MLDKTVSVGSLLVFARTGNFPLLLVTQQLDILLTTTAGQMLVGGFLPSGGVGLWGILAPLGALVFLEVRQAVRSVPCAAGLHWKSAEHFQRQAPPECRVVPVRYSTWCGRQVER